MASFADLGIEERPGTARYVTTCPRCSHTRKKKDDKCLTINNEVGNRWWHCNHPECGWKGNLETHEKYEKVKENARLPKNVGQIKSYSKEVSAYLNKRGLTTATCLKEEVYEPTGSRNLIAFPFYISLTIVNIKFLNLSPAKGKPKWFQLPKSLNTSTCFLGLANLELDKNPNRKKNYVIITEGEVDWLTWKECSYKNVLSVPMGAPSEKAKDFSKEFAYVHEKYFQSIKPYIDTFYLSVDDDGPGKLLKDQLALLLGKERCRVIKYPPGQKDINDVLTHNKELTKDYDKDAVKRCFTDASSYPIKGIIRPSDLRYELMQLSDGGLVPGIGTGIGEFDYMMTFKRQHISFWTGVPGCFTGEQLIHTEKGVAPISEIKTGDRVLSYNHSIDQNEYRHVLKTHKHKNHSGKLYKITLKDGTVINVTDNHEFFTGDRYLQITEIIRLFVNKLKNK